MHIVIEGPDGAGKTVLAKRLAETLGMDYRHEGPPPAGVDAFKHYIGMLRTMPTVFDRFAFGEMVYGPLLRGKSGVTFAELLLLRDVLRLTHSRVVLCLPPFDACLANMKDRKELITDPEQIRSAYDRWIEFSTMRNLGIFNKIYDYTA